MGVLLRLLARPADSRRPDIIWATCVGFKGHHDHHRGWLECKLRPAWQRVKLHLCLCGAAKHESCQGTLFCQSGPFSPREQATSYLVIKLARPVNGWTHFIRRSSRLFSAQARGLKRAKGEEVGEMKAGQKISFEC